MSEVREVKISDLKMNELAKQLSKSEDMKPYVDYFVSVVSDDAEKRKAAVQALRNLPLERRYTQRIFRALQLAFEDFDSESVKLDLPHLSEEELLEMMDELNIRTLQLQILHGTLSSVLTEQK